MSEASLIEKATTDIVDLATNLRIVDYINTKPERAEKIIQLLWVRLGISAQVTLVALELVDMLIKNCPSTYESIGSKIFMTKMSELTEDTDFKVREVAVDFIQFYGPLFRYRDDLQFYNTYVKLKTKNIKFPSIRQDPWKPEGYKKVVDNAPANEAVDGPITTNNLYYKINLLTTSQNLFEEAVQNAEKEGVNDYIKELHVQCLKLHQHFVKFIEGSGHKCQEQVLINLLQLNDSFATTIKKYDTVKDKKPVVNNQEVKKQKKEKQVDKPLIGNLLDFTTKPNVNQNLPTQPPSLIDFFSNPSPNTIPSQTFFPSLVNPTNLNQPTQNHLNPMPKTIFNLQPISPNNQTTLNPTEFNPQHNINPQLFQFPNAQPILPVNSQTNFINPQQPTNTPANPNLIFNLQPDSGNPTQINNYQPNTNAQPPVLVNEQPNFINLQSIPQLLNPNPQEIQVKTDLGNKTQQEENVDISDPFAELAIRKNKK